MMTENTNYREIIPNQSAFRRWKDIKVNTGTAQSTLQDISLPESAGGFGYRESNRVDSVTRHRFIYWKISHDVLELVEQSLDYNLHGNQVRFRFQDTPVLEGVSIHETSNNVIVLVATVFSVHRFLFTHPNKLQRHDFLHSDRSWPSIFADASVSPSGTHGYQLTNHSSVIPRSAASWMTPDGDAVFAVASNLDKIVVVRMPAAETQNSTSVHELRQTSIMKRLWTGFIPASIRGSQETGDSAVSVVIHAMDKEIFVFALGRDAKLRMWSCRDYECVMMTDVLELISESAPNNRKLHGSQPHILRKSLGSTNTCLHLGLYICLASSRHICVVQPVNNLGQFSLQLITTVNLPEYHLVDFNLTMTQIWALWITAESETVLNVATVNPGDEDLTWRSVILETWDREFHFMAALMDPREAFMQKIFAPGKFSVQTITRAISIYRRAADAPFIADVNVPIDVLQEEVTSVVEKEIRTQASQYEMTDGEYLQLQLDCWSKFFSGCLQYQDVESKIMGLAVDHKTGLVCLIKKSQFSLIRLQDPVELWFLSQGSPLLQKNVACLTAITDDVSLWADLITMSRCLSLIDTQLTDEVKDAFECDLLHQHNPNDIVPAIVESLLAPENSLAMFLTELAYATSSIVNLAGVIEALLSSVDLAHGQSNDLAFDNGIETSRHNLCSHLFASDAGCSLVAKSVYQMSKVRFELCRNLLFYIHFLRRVTELTLLTPAVINKLQTHLIVQTGILLRTYHVLLWASQTPASQVPRNTIESGLCQLSLLNITDVPGTPTLPKTEKPLNQAKSLVELFVRSDGGTQSRCLLAQNQFLDNDTTSSWSQVLTPLVQTVGQLVWPISAQFAFPEFLLVQCQYLQLSEYARLLNGWCEWNSASRQFLLGHVALNLGEADKSVDWFLAASKGIRREEFLWSKVLQQVEVGEESSELVTNYFLKVIHLLEQFGLADQIITVANNALALVDKNDKNVSTLWSIVFKYQLELEHNQEAYAAICNNPDFSRKKDCLRQLVVVLCERRQYQTLVEFPYIELHEEFVAILESRARSVDLTTHNYYDVLYSFHVFRGDFRKASSVMYEYGLRLGLEVPGLKGLQRQAKCYLTTLNCLRMVDPNYAWIVKPIMASTDKSNEDEVVFGTSPKRNIDGEDVSQKTPHRELKVLELSAIKKEYDLLHARLQLYRKEPDTTNIGGILSISETIGLLVTVGLFDAAIHLCRTFSLTFHPVLEGLTTRCVQLSKSTKGDDAITKAWDWLSENDLSDVDVGTKTTSTDYAWALLRSYVFNLETKGQSVYHRCVSTKLLSSEFSLPTWLAASYKIINVAELICLYLDFDLLEETTQLVLEYIDAVMGKGKEYFGLSNALHPNSSPVWVPYTLIDHLSMSLAEFEDDPICYSLLEEINHKMDEYEKTLDVVSKDMIRLGEGKGKNVVEIM